MATGLARKRAIRAGEPFQFGNLCAAPRDPLRGGSSRSSVPGLGSRGTGAALARTRSRRTCARRSHGPSRMVRKARPTAGLADESPADCHRSRHSVRAHCARWKQLAKQSHDGRTVCGLGSHLDRVSKGSGEAFPARRISPRTKEWPLDPKRPAGARRSSNSRCLPDGGYPLISASSVPAEWSATLTQSGYFLFARHPRTSRVLFLPPELFLPQLRGPVEDEGKRWRADARGQRQEKAFSV